jgi:hypothetical protein
MPDVSNKISKMIRVSIYKFQIPAPIRPTQDKLSRRFSLKAALEAARGRSIVDPVSRS